MLCGMRSVVALALGLALLSGCGSAPEEIDSTGTDGLTVPTPSPDAADFVDGVDNRWLPLSPGTTSTYDASGRRARSLVVEVLESPREVAGVVTTVVRTTTHGAKGRILSDTEAYYAQDEAGNVWIFGRTGADAWQAGEGGSQATLVMAEDPRHGDGYAAEYLDGEVTRTAEVLDTGATVSTPYGAFDDVVEVEEQSVPEGPVTVRSYAPGVGLVEQDAIEGIDLELVSVTH